MGVRQAQRIGATLPLMGVPSKAKAKEKIRSRPRHAQRPARPSSSLPSWAVTSPEEKKELDELHERVLDGREKLTRILL